MQTRQVLSVIAISALTSVASVWGYNKFTQGDTYFYPTNNGVGSDSGKVPSNYAHFENGSVGNNVPTDFTAAASSCIPATVHIKTKATRQASNNLPRRSPFSDLFGDGFEEFFGNPYRSMPQSASGSGAIISEDGYIVTNNHVIDGADEITVTLNNKKSFKAKLIGADPSSDLAVIKVEAKGLPFLVYGNSDEVKIGQWVLAVGYPLNLETTVTAGIVSAKGRTLDINRRQSASPIESFIQTDAAVNPGNSGGPLITLDGRLVGINSAIASPTGSFAGYSFTIPVNIVKKIVSDLMKFGTAQRAYLGIEYAPDNISEEVKKQNGIQDGEGVYVTNTPANGAAKAAGIQKGDFITKVNGIQVNTGAEMVGQIAIYRPGDKVKIAYRRNGKDMVTDVVLRNSTGTTSVVKTSSLDKLGATLEAISEKEAAKMGVKGGVAVRSLVENGLMERSRVQEGFVILKVNGREVSTVDDVRKALEESGATARLEGIFPGYEGVYQFPLRLNEAR